MHFSEEAAYGVIVLAIMQQQEPCIARCDICCDEQVVKPIHCLQQNTHVQMQ